MTSMDVNSEQRRRAMSAFATMPSAMLAERFSTIVETAPAALPVRGPDVGLVMVRGRTGGGGAAFNLGEASVARATVKLATGEVGHALILGREMDRARMAAHLDAIWQRPEWRSRIEADFVAPALEAQASEAVRRAEETEATRVDFFTLVRGED